MPVTGHHPSDPSSTRVTDPPGVSRADLSGAHRILTQFLNLPHSWPECAGRVTGGERPGRARVLVVDDEVFLADLVAAALRYAGFDASAVGSCLAAESVVGDLEPDLVVLDVMLPDGSGLDLCRRLRARGYGVPVVFLTARHDTRDKVAGLTVGGDDYLAKPFSLDELVARVQAILRRTRPAALDHRPATMSYLDLELDEDAHEVRRRGIPVELGPTEFNVLRYLLQNAGLVVSKRQIIDQVWRYDFDGNDSVVATYISYLRRKIDCFDPPLIHTVSRVGYVLRNGSAAAPGS